MTDKHRCLCLLSNRWPQLFSQIVITSSKQLNCFPATGLLLLLFFFFGPHPLHTPHSPLCNSTPRNTNGIEHGSIVNLFLSHFGYFITLLIHSFIVSADDRGGGFAVVYGCQFKRDKRQEAAANHQAVATSSSGLQVGPKEIPINENENRVGGE